MWLQQQLTKRESGDVGAGKEDEGGEGPVSVLSSSRVRIAALWGTM